VEDPADHLSFEEIVDRLVKMEFKVTLNMNPLKLSAFIKEINGNEASSAGMSQ
jgi:hypothetical protein